MNRETACKIVGGIPYSFSSKGVANYSGQRKNAKSRETRSKNIMKKIRAENPSFNPANVEKALTTIGQVCTQNPKMAPTMPATALKTLETLKQAGLDKYILPPVNLSPTIAPAPVNLPTVASAVAKVEEEMESVAPNLPPPAEKQVTEAVQEVVEQVNTPNTSLAQVNATIKNANKVVNNTKNTTNSNNTKKNTNSNSIKKQLTNLSGKLNVLSAKLNKALSAPAAGGKRTMKRKLTYKRKH